MLAMNSERFGGSCVEGCQEASIPKALPAIVEMILDGPSIEAHSKAAALKCTIQ